MTSPRLQLRPASPDDVPSVMAMIRALAEFEKLAHEVKTDELGLSAALFPKAGPPAAEAVMADLDGRTVGFALFFHNFSTWTGIRGLYLEDLFVLPEARGRGVGGALLRHLAAIAVRRGCARFEWVVLDWNQRAIDVYEALGARPLSEWKVYRLAGEPLKALAAEAPE